MFARSELVGRSLGRLRLSSTFYLLDFAARTLADVEIQEFFVLSVSLLTGRMFKRENPRAEKYENRLLKEIWKEVPSNRNETRTTRSFVVPGERVNGYSRGRATRNITARERSLLVEVRFDIFLALEFYRAQRHRRSKVSRAATVIHSTDNVREKHVANGVHVNIPQSDY